jgi:hypothetical protein
MLSRTTRRASRSRPLRRVHLACTQRPEALAERVEQLAQVEQIADLALAENEDLERPLGELRPL